MFRTAIRDDHNPERIARTAALPRGKRMALSFTRPLAREEQFREEETLRPMTTQLKTPKGYQTLDTTGKSANLVNLRSIDAVEEELQSEFKEDMSSYLRLKLRKLVGRRQEDIAYSRYLSSTIDEAELQNHSRASQAPLDHFYSTLRRGSGLKVEKGVDGAYLSNAKEHVHRMIQRQREQKEDRKDICLSIKSRRQQKQERRSRSLKDHFKVREVEGESWDRAWRQSVVQEKARYRNRLLGKNSRQNSCKWKIQSEE